MICAYYGIENISLAIIREFAKTDREGNSMYSLKIAADKLHMDTQAFRATKEDLINGEAKFPIIVHTVVDGLYQHYMVLFEVNKKGVVLGDPANGQVNMKWEDFEKIWTGEILTFEPRENFKDNKKYKRNFKIIFELMFKFKWYLVGLLAISSLISGISVIAASFYSKLIDNIIPDSNLNSLVQLLLVTIGVYILTIVVNWVKLKVSISFNRKLDKELVIDIYNRITNLPMSFFATRTAGDLSARFSDGNAIRSLVTSYSLDIIIDVVYAIVALVAILINNSWQIAILTLIMVECVVVIRQIFKKKIEENAKKISKANLDVYSFANASFTGSETIKSYNSEKYIQNQMDKKYKEFQKVEYKSQKIFQAEDDLIDTVAEVSSLFMLSILGILVMCNQITMGELMFLYTMQGYLMKPVQYIFSLQDELTEASAALERLDDVFRTTTEQEINKTRRNINEPIERIEFRDVTFQYGLRDPILKNISFDINKGESIGVIGTSGCGKTTLIKLILSFYEVTEGSIFINDDDINNITTSSLRKKIAYVSQNDFWFQDSIFNNLIIGNTEASSEEVMKVLDTVKMSDFIEKKASGLNTIIEENGTNLSTGEKQRLSLAKALITKPEVLILDESTSNLDAETEEFIVGKLASEKDKIKIVIAHRLNTLAQCDKIISLKDGKIIEMGTPKELLRNKGMFYELWNIQNKQVNQKMGIQIQ